MMVGWQHQQAGVGIYLLGQQSRQADRRCGVAATGLENDAIVLNASEAQLLGGDKPVVFVADNNRWRAVEALDAL